jgi:glycosyltransferase involved in cell wall biosynthesis
MNELSASIIIPCYNAEPWLASTLESALAQSLPEKEIIVVDDGSTDRSLDVAKTYESRGVRVIHQSNRGASAARNRALAEATGDFIQFLDADDLLHTRKLETQVSALRERPAGFVASGRWGRFVSGVEDARFVDVPVFRNLSSMQFLRLAAHEGHMMHPAAWLTPAKIAREAGPWDESLSLNDDGEYFARVLLASRGIIYCAEAVSYYRSSIPGSLSKRKDNRAKRSLFHSLELTASHMIQADPSAETRCDIAAMYQRALHEIYPAPKDLIDETVRRIGEFGGKITAPPMGPRSKMLARFIGWKATKRIADFLGK